MVGRTLAHYRILEQLGAGGMGVVYRAVDERLERDVAIKVLPLGALHSEPARSRFRKEALALAKLNHPNIATVYDVGREDGMDYIVMEYVPGESLAEKLRSGPLPPKEVLALGGEIAGALEEAHEHGVIHRDLKPGNIVVTPKGHAKVLDFGLAKLLAQSDGDRTQSLADSDGPVGTILYMSPEQADGKVVDSRTDLWSLGAVLYESLAGKTPFEGDSGLAVLRALSLKTPKPLRELRADTPPEADRIVSRALEKDVSKRYQSAADMSRDLSAALTRISVSELAPRSGEVRVARKYAIVAGILGLVLVTALAWLYHKSERQRWAREDAIPEINKLQAADKPLAAFQLLKESEQYLPGDPKLAEIRTQSTRTVSINSAPEGATVEIQDYLSPNSKWFRLGATPLNGVVIPNGYFRWRVSKPGTGEYLAAPPTENTMEFSLDAARAAPPEMVPVSGGRWLEMVDFIGWVGPFNLPPYYLDRFEVTNREFQEFIDRGGYKDKQYWTEKFIQNGRELNWDEAMLLFRDRTGREGPSTWEGGHYPEGQADYPVSGVSWYEAAAYAAFAGKSLPALSQWYQAAPNDLARYIVRESNISLSAAAPVGKFMGLGPYGTYDMAGNVREWVQNAVGDTRLILGGAWNSQTYLASDPEALPPFDRSPTDGIRCVKNLAPLPKGALDPVKPLARDFAAVKPLPDDVFRAYEALYAYDKKPLNAKVEGVVQETADWREEKISFLPAYGNERMSAYLFLPKNVKPPYQTVVFFPSARVLDIPNSRTLGDIKFFDYIVQSGRAVFYPIYQGTYERQRKLVAPGQTSDVEFIAQQYKDLARSLDYLETRSDIDRNKLAYLGVSAGAAGGVIYATLAQDRLKTVVLLDGGYFLFPPPAAIDQVNFAPRLKRPVLMVNGRYDFTFSVEKAQQPLFRMLGTPEADKKHVILDTPHDVTERRTELVQTVLAWLDKYLGRVE